jgi:arylsulfatase A-like enzyme
VHFEFSLRGGFLTPRRRILDLDWRSCDLAVLRTRTHKYVHFQKLPPLLFDLRDDPGELHDRAADPACRATMLALAQRMLDWRMHNAERELVNLSASPDGLVVLA